MSCIGDGEGGNREVSPLYLFGVRGDLSGAGVEAHNPEEGPEPKAREEAA